MEQDFSVLTYFNEEVFFAKLYQIKKAAMGDDPRDYLAAWMGLMSIYGIKFKTDQEFVTHLMKDRGVTSWETSMLRELGGSVLDWFVYFAMQTDSFKEHTFIRCCKMAMNLEKAHIPSL